VVAVALTLGASLAWGRSDFLAGFKSRQLAVVWVLLVSQSTGLVLVTVAAVPGGEPLPRCRPLSGRSRSTAPPPSACSCSPSRSCDPRPLDREAYPPLAAVGALDVAANVMFASAVTVGMAATVSVLGSLYPLATVVLARALVSLA
jgi:hypothetical protein